MNIQTPLKFPLLIKAALVFALFSSFSCGAALRAQDAGEHKKVLFIFNNDSFTATQDAIDRAARAVLKGDSNIPVETYSEYVGDTRTGTDYEKEFVALVKKKYEGKHFDL